MFQTKSLTLKPCFQASWNSSLSQIKYWYIILYLLYCMFSSLLFQYFCCKGNKSDRVEYWIIHLLTGENCTVLCCTVLYCTVLYCTVLYCTVLYCTVLYCTVLYCTVLYCTVLYCTVLYCTVLYCTVLYCTVINCVVLRWYPSRKPNMVYVPPLCFNCFWQGSYKKNYFNGLNPRGGSNVPVFF